MNKDICPVCGEAEVTTTAIPDRKVVLHPLTNKNEEGDKVKCNCSFCGWWSEGTYTENAPPPLTHTCGKRCYKQDMGDSEPVHVCKKPNIEAYNSGPGWVWKTSRPPSQKQRERLEYRLKKLKKQRRKRGFK